LNLSAAEIGLICLSAGLDNSTPEQLTPATRKNAFPYYTISHSWAADTPVEVLPESQELRLELNVSTQRGRQTLPK
jgi:hypothetical protein